MSSSNQGFVDRHGNKVRWAAIAVILVAVMLLMRALPMDVLQGALEAWVEKLGVWGPVVFGLIYVVATVVLIPASLLTLAAGAVFGLWLGLVTVSIAATTGAALAFLIARYMARSKVEKMAESNERFGAIDDAISEGGWKIVAMLRLSPAVPFGLQNYLYGLTDIKFLPYVLTSWIAMLPGTFMYVYLGLAAKSAAGGGEGRSTGEWVLLGVGLAATIAVTIYITKLAKSKLAERTDVKEDDNQDEKAKGPSSGAVWATVGAAVLLLALGIFAQTRKESLSETVEGWVSSPTSSAERANSADS